MNSAYAQSNFIFLLQLSGEALNYALADAMRLSPRINTATGRTEVPVTPKLERVMSITFPEAEYGSMVEFSPATNPVHAVIIQKSFRINAKRFDTTGDKFIPLRKNNTTFSPDDSRKAAYLTGDTVMEATTRLALMLTLGLHGIKNNLHGYDAESVKINFRPSVLARLRTFP